MKSGRFINPNIKFLPVVELPPTKGKANRAMIVLHGWGANQHDLIPLAQSLKQPSTHCFFPNAPFDVPGTGGTGKGWFSFPPTDKSQEERRESREKLRILLNKVSAHGFDYSSIIIMGFSQGAAMALDVMLNIEQRVGAVICLSGFLMNEGEIRSQTNSPKTTPVFAAHGLYDPILPFEQSKRSLQVLKDAGFDLTWREYQMEHEIVPEEVDAIQDFLSSTN